MRETRSLLPVLIPVLAALALGGCMRKEPAYSAIDPNSGQAVPMASQQQLTQPDYVQQQDAQQAYAARPAPSRGRGLFSFPSSRAYALQQDAQPANAPPPEAAPPPAAGNSRGLYSSSPAYAQQAYAEPAYAPDYAPPHYAQAQAADTGGRGLFTPRRAPPVYAQPAPPQAYEVQNAGPQYAAPQPAEAYAAAPFAPAGEEQPYTLDAGDKLRVVVFGQAGISNTYIVGAGGKVNLPLIGAVAARGLTTEQLSHRIAAQLKQGYVRDPHVSVEIETYRPFFILGEVTTPGQYPYVANMTAETAVAIAGGFAPRAYKRSVEITRNAAGGQVYANVPLNTPIRPGDTVKIKERWF